MTFFFQSKEEWPLKWHYPKYFHQMFARITCLFMEGNERVYGKWVNLVIGCCTYNMVLMTTSQWEKQL